MKGKFRSIGFKIWWIITTSIIIFFVIALIINFTVITKIKDEFIFDHLKEASHSMKALQENFPEKNGDRRLPLNKPIGPTQIENFKIRKNTEGGLDLIIDPFMRDFYKDNEIPEGFKMGEKLFEKIIDRIEKNKNNKGVLKENLKEINMLIFYYVNWEKDSSDKVSENATVFLTSLPQNNDLETGLFLGIFLLFIISFFISIIISKKIANPVKELKLFAEEIAKRNWKVEVPTVENDEIGLLTEALEKMRDSLKMYEERDREFLQSTSHDLKTPVMIIKGYAQSMIDGITINSERSGAEIIKSESERLERKITQLLRLNILSHSLEYNKSTEYIRIDRILKNLISKFKIINPKLNWIVDLKEIEIQGDSEALLIAFENIIENQLRFAENVISVIMKKEEKNEIIISNDGPHFQVENPNILFETYIKDRSGKFGLGLSIVKQIIKSHNGSVVAYNIEKGVEFKILI
jgi:two-component system sensor histidine kinase CssS